MSIERPKVLKVNVRLAGPEWCRVELYKTEKDTGWQVRCITLMSGHVWQQTRPRRMGVLTVEGMLQKMHQYGLLWKAGKDIFPASLRQLLNISHEFRTKMVLLILAVN